MPGAHRDQLLGLWLCGGEEDRKRWLPSGMIERKKNNDQGKILIINKALDA